jgi:hypothetical protein
MSPENIVARRGKSMRVNVFGKAVIVPLLTSAIAAIAGAQDVVVDATSRPSGGLRLYNVSAYSDWYSAANSSLGIRQSQPGSTVAIGSGVMVGAQRTRGTKELWFAYSASYQTIMQYQALRSHAQFASGGISWHLKPRWVLSATGTGADTTAMEALLNPSTSVAFRATPVTIDDLATAAASGSAADPRAVSYLTGSPFISSNTQLFLFGRRLLSLSSSVTLTWSKSPRMRVYFGGVSAAARHIPQREGDVQDRYPSPRTIGANAGVGFSYDMSPRTQIGLSGGIERRHATFQDAYISTAGASLGHRLSPHWFVHADVGGGTYARARSAFPVSHGPQVIGTAQIGYQKRAHTVVLVQARTLSDPYGFGVGRQSSTAGTWSWRRKTWLVYASVGRQQIESMGVATLNGWTASSGISRLLNSQLSLQIQQAYLNTYGSFSGTPDRYQLHSIRMSLNWSPSIGLNLLHRNSR